MEALRSHNLMGEQKISEKIVLMACMCIKYKNRLN